MYIILMIIVVIVFMMIIEVKIIGYHINNIIYKKNEHKTFYLIRKNIGMNLGFKNGNWGDLGGSSVIL